MAGKLGAFSKSPWPHVLESLGGFLGPSPKLYTGDHGLCDSFSRELLSSPGKYRPASLLISLMFIFEGSFSMGTYMVQ